MTKMKDVDLIGAAKIMEILYASYFYPTYKKLEYTIEQVKNSMKERQKEKRREYADIGVIGKFQAVNQYETDWLGLNEHLNDIGILPVVARIDTKFLKEHHPDVLELLQPFQNPRRSYIRMTPNKAGRVEKEELNFSFYKDEDLAKLWLDIKSKLNRFDQQLEVRKRFMQKCPELRMKKKLTCNYGSVSLLYKNPTYNIERIYEENGPDFLIEYGRVDMQRLDYFIERGLINPSDIKPFRKIKDIQLRYIVTDLEAEAKQFEFFHSKLLRVMENRRAG